MKIGKANIMVILVIVLSVLIIGFFGYLQYRHYVQQKNIERIENEILNSRVLN